MRKIILSLLIIFGIIFLTGCDSNRETVDILLNNLQNQKIVDSNLELVDKVHYIDAGPIPSGETYYIYKNKDNKLISISYDTTTIFETGEYDHLVTIYDDVNINKDVVIYDNKEDAQNRARIYTYIDGTYTSENKYKLSNIKKYEVYKKKILFFTKYKFQLQE